MPVLDRGDGRVRQPEQALAEATAAVHAARAVGDLVRTVMTSQIRARRAAAGLVVEVLGLGTTARHFGIAPAPSPT